MAGIANVVPSGLKSNTMPLTEALSGSVAAGLVTSTVIVTSWLRAPAGMTSVAPPAVTVPPAGPTTVPAGAGGAGGGTGGAGAGAAGGGGGAAPSSPQATMNSDPTAIGKIQQTLAMSFLLFGAPAEATESGASNRTCDGDAT
jgi:hypothetical protein